MALKYPPLRLNRKLAGDLFAIQSEQVKNDDARELLGRLLQSALQLEFSTVPLYLSAAFSLTDLNENISELVVRIAQEEMLHMAAVANLMNAIGIPPDIKAAVPQYPYSLSALDPPIQLDLKSFSLDLVERLFMRVETPEDPVPYPMGPLAKFLAAPKTIGQFYEDIIELIENDTIPDLFKDAEQDAYKQIKVVPNFRGVAYTSNDDNHEYPLSEDIDFIIDGKDSAVRHLMWVVDQGEGAAPFDPLTAEGLPGHYYRFESILKRKYLVVDTSVQEGYSYSGGDLPFSPAGVNEFDVNARVEDYAAFPRVHPRMKQFNEKYTEMIEHLHVAFNCPGPEQQQQANDTYQMSLTIMRGLSGAASRIVRAAAADGVKAGIPFQFRP